MLQRVACLSFRVLMVEFNDEGESDSKGLGRVY